MLDNRLVLNGAIFRYDYQDYQLSQTVGTVVVVNNAASAKVDGLELEAVWRPDDHWLVSSYVTLLNARYEAFTNFDPVNPAAGNQNFSLKATASTALRKCRAVWGSLTRPPTPI